MIEHFNLLLESIVEHPEARISELAILSDAERQRLLVDWNDTRTEFPKGLTIHQMFEEQVNRDPNRVAFIYEDRQLTYGELNTRAC
jgi:non-ribosomal peptide synthetase component F